MLVILCIEPHYSLLALPIISLLEVIMNVSELKPYKSFTLAELPESMQPKSMTEVLLSDMKTLMGLNENSERLLFEEKSLSIDSDTDDGSIWAGFFHYQEFRKPTWYAGGEEFLDSSNELVLIFQRERQFGIFLTDTRKRSALKRKLGDGQGEGLGIFATH